MNVLLTSFDPFGAEVQNSSLEILRRLPDRLECISLVKEVLPTQFVEAPRRLQTLLREIRPDLVLLLGQAGGRKQVHFERVAINCMSARIPDNAGYAPQEIPVLTDAPAAYFTNIPLADLVRHLQDRWMPAAVSNSAGTFVCNCLFYHAMHQIVTESLPCLCDFVHIPYLAGQSHVPPNTPCLSAESCVSTIREAISFLARSSE